MIALAAYAGRGTPRLVDTDRALGAILMERILPGEVFRAWGNRIERSHVSMPLICELPLPMDALDGLPTFAAWLEKAFREFRQRFDDSHGFLGHIEAAERSWRVLREQYPENYLLHGDLHHENILKDASRGWVAIDPKGVIGPKPMEAGRFLHNFLEDEIDGVESFADASIDDLCQVLDVRLDVFADTMDVPRDDLARANYVDAVLSFCWTLNSNPAYSDFQPVEASFQLLTN